MFKEFAKKVKWDNILVATLTMVLGILCLVLPSSMSNILCYVFGAFLIAIGVSLLIRYFALDLLLGSYLLIFGIVTITFGVFCFIYPQMLLGILTILFGLFIIIESCTTITDSILLAKSKQHGWSIIFILSILTAIFGIIIMFGTFETIMMLAGIALIVEGVIQLTLTFVYSYKIKKAKNELIKQFNVIELDDNDYKME